MLEAGFSDEVVRRGIELAANRLAVVFFELTGAARNNDFCRVFFLGPPGDSDVMLDRPVAIIARSLAAAGTDQQRWRIARQDFPREPTRSLVERNIPAQVATVRPDRGGKFHEPVKHVLLWPGRNFLVGEKPLEVSSAPAVETDLARRSQQGIDAVSSHGRVHAQANVESSRAQLSAQLPVCRQAVGLVENDKLDVGNVAQ